MVLCSLQLDVLSWTERFEYDGGYPELILDNEHSFGCFRTSDRGLLAWDMLIVGVSYIIYIELRRLTLLEYLGSILSCPTKYLGT